MNNDDKNTQNSFVEPQELKAGRQIWRYFLSGLLVASPIGLTLYIIWFIVTLVDEKARQILPAEYFIERYLPFEIPGFGILLAFVFFTLVGFLATGVLGRLFARFGEAMLTRTPLVRSLYNTFKQIFEAVFNRDQNSFREVVLVEYPRRGTWCLGFVTGATRGEVQDGTSQEVINVFIPTTPNPTSGFLLFVPRSELKVLSMSIEEGIKMVVSGGIITPTYPKPVPTLV